MRTLALFVAVASALALGGCSQGDRDAVFMSVDAGGATFASDPSATLRSGYVDYLTISGLDHGVVFITLSPDNQAWTGSPKDVVDFFGEETLNAVALSPRTGEAVALSLAYPTYDTATGSLRFEARGLDDLGGAEVVSAPDESLVPAKEGEWGPITLFVDPTTNIKTPGVYVADATCTLTLDNQLPAGSTITVAVRAPLDNSWTGPDIGSAVTNATQSWTYPGCANMTATLSFDVATPHIQPVQLDFSVDPDSVHLEANFAFGDLIVAQVNGRVVTLTAP